MNEKELDMNELIRDFNEYSTDYNKTTCEYYEELVNSLSKTRNKLLDLRNNKIELESSINELNNKMKNRDSILKKFDGHTCPTCNSIVDSIIFKHSQYNCKQDYLFLSQSLEVQYVKIIDEIEKEEETYKEFSDKLESYNKKIRSINKNIDSVIKHKGYIEMRDKMQCDLNETNKKLLEINSKLKEELGDKFEEYMYGANINLLNKWNELKEWVTEQEQKAWDEVSSTFGYVLDKMQKLEQGKDE